AKTAEERTGPRARRRPCRQCLVANRAEQRDRDQAMNDQKCCRHKRVPRTIIRQCSLEEFHGSERLGRPPPEGVEGKLRLVAGFNVHEDVVVLLFGRLTLPIEIRRIVCWYLDARPAWENRVLFGAAA